MSTNQGILLLWANCHIGELIFALETPTNRPVRSFQFWLRNLNGTASARMVTLSNYWYRAVGVFGVLPSKGLSPKAPHYYAGENAALSTDIS